MCLRYKSFIGNFRFEFIIKSTLQTYTKHRIVAILTHFAQTDDTRDRLFITVQN